MTAFLPGSAAVSAAAPSARFLGQGEGPAGGTPVLPGRKFHLQQTGGLVLGGGGFFIPMRKYSPVSFRFQPTR